MRCFFRPIAGNDRIVDPTLFTGILSRDLAGRINWGKTGYLVTSDLWIKAVINTVEKGPVDAIWQKGGEDTTSRGDTVIWGHFYASPSDVTWGSQDNPDLFVKIWFDVSGRIDVNFFHVSVPNIEVYSDYPYDGTWDQHGTTKMDYRYVRHEYWTSTHASIVGSWGSGYYPNGIYGGEPEEYISLTFYPNGYYIHYETGQLTEPCDNGGGVEYGTYTYDPSSQQLFVSPILDENGCVGLAEDGEQTISQVDVSEDMITYYEDGVVDCTLERVKDGSSSIVGSWGSGYYPNGIYGGEPEEYISLTFYPNGYYIHYETGQLTEPCDNGGGVEYDTYTYDPSSQQLFVSPILDENGCVGLAEDGEQTISQVDVSEDMITWYEESVVDCILERVK